MHKIPFSPESSRIKCPAMNETYPSPLLDTNQIDYIIRMFPLQVSLMCVMTAAIQVFLKPLGETPVVALIMSGILIGPSVFGRLEKVQKNLFPTLGGTFLIDTLGNFGCMIYIFQMGVKMDLSVLKRSSKPEKAIGILTFIVPLIFTVSFSFFVIKCAPSFFEKELRIDNETLKGLNLYETAIMASTSSFHVIACFLADLKILNTELGRIATSASTISGMCSWTTIMIIMGKKDNEDGEHLALLKFISSTLAQVILITVVLRRIVISMIKRTPQGEPVKDIYIFSIFIMVLGTGLIGEICGQHFIFGPMILGLSIPNGPPVGSALVDKWDTFTSAILLPLYFCSIGNRVDLRFPTRQHSFTAIPLCLLGSLGKLTGTLIACLFYQIPFKEALMLGLSLCTLGIVDVHNYRIAYQSKVITPEIFSIMVTAALNFAGVITPVVHLLYDPTRRYLVSKKRTIQHLKPNSELRVLVSIFNDQNVLTIVKILQASNPTKECPIVIYLLHLIELMGRSTPLLITHKSNVNNFMDPTPSDRIINSFRIFEKKYNGGILVHPFTSITPFLSAQEDICTLALNKRTSFIIIPFHKQWNIDGTSQIYKWRNTNKRLLKQAPCSVGILIDRGVLNGSRSVLATWSKFAIVVIFLGDADDREALCYAMRMAGDIQVNLTVYRIILVDNLTDDVTEKMLDENVIDEYRLYKDIERNQYKEEVVKDGVGIISMIQRMDNSYDLILVGRSHASYYNLFSGLMEWNECPELGFFGDMLASSDFTGNASVLVIQQHSSLQIDAIRDEAHQSYTSHTWK